MSHCRHWASQDNLEICQLTPRELSRALRAIGWNSFRLSRQLACSESVTHRWMHGTVPVPDLVAQWLARLEHGHNGLLVPRRTGNAYHYASEDRAATGFAVRPLLESIGWQMADVATALGCSHSIVRHWTSGARSVPAPVADWLIALAALHDRWPAPEPWWETERKAGQGSCGSDRTGSRVAG